VLQVNRLKYRFRREGVEDTEEVVDMLAKELNISRHKAVGVSADRPTRRVTDIVGPPSVTLGDDGHQHGVTDH
jgi:hypothetical protein